MFLDEKYFYEVFQKNELACNEELFKKFNDYAEFLCEYNEKVNLTAITEPGEIILKHFIDSLVILKYVDIKKNSKIIDVGTGAGFPGIPLAIMNESLKVTLVDSLNKRLIFLQEVINELNLKNVDLVNDRAEEFIKKEKRETYDFCFCRGVSKLNVILEYAIPFLKENALFLPQKMEVLEEINEAENALKVLNSKLIEIHNLELPFSLDKRVIIEIKKIKKTDLKYPRRTGIPLKKPL